MKIFMIGGTGFISTSLTRKLLERGHEVTLFTRGNSMNNLPGNPNLHYEYGNRDNTASLQNAVRDKTYDIVYDMIAYLPGQSESAAKIFKKKIGRFIHCSTISVYMISDDICLPITEDQNKLSIMDYFARNPFGMDYGINKRKCEDILWSEHDEKYFPVSMLRPTFVSGPGDPAKRDFFWIERILDGNPLLVPGSGDFKFQQIFIEDAAEAFAKIIETDKSIGKAYNAASEEVFTLNEYLQRLCSLLQSAEMIHIDQSKFDMLEISYSNNGDVFPFNTRRDSVFSLEKIRKDLGFTSTLFDEWMPKTINWFLNEYKDHSVGYEKRSKEIEIINKINNNFSEELL